MTPRAGRDDAPRGAPSRHPEQARDSAPPRLRPVRGAELAQDAVDVELDRARRRETRLGADLAVRAGPATSSRSTSSSRRVSTPSKAARSSSGAPGHGRLGAGQQRPAPRPKGSKRALRSRSAARASSQASRRRSCVALLAQRERQQARAVVRLRDAVGERPQHVAVERASTSPGRAAVGVDPARPARRARRPPRRRVARPSHHGRERAVGAVAELRAADDGRAPPPADLHLDQRRREALPGSRRAARAPPPPARERRAHARPRRASRRRARG